MKWLLLFSHAKRVYSKATKKSYWFKINFITLTLSHAQMHSDEYIKRHMLYPFLRWMARSHNAKLYLWKAEAQKNGNIHFHITTNTFIHWKSIRRKWNSIQSKHGYQKVWTDGNIHPDPNSTDVHAVIREEQVANYMVKYMLKNQTDRRLITGRLWACSPELSNLKITFDQHDKDFYQSAELIKTQSDLKVLEHATLYLHRPLNKMQLNPSLRERLSEQFKKVASKINTQTYFTIE
jgi:hypothetical protein